MGTPCSVTIGMTPTCRGTGQQDAIQPRSSRPRRGAGSAAVFCRGTVGNARSGPEHFGHARGTGSGPAAPHGRLPISRGMAGSGLAERLVRHCRPLDPGVFTSCPSQALSRLKPPYLGARRTPGRRGSAFSTVRCTRGPERGATSASGLRTVTTCTSGRAPSIRLIGRSRNRPNPTVPARSVAGSRSAPTQAFRCNRRGRRGRTPSRAATPGLRPRPG